MLNNRYINVGITMISVKFNLRKLHIQSRTRDLNIENIHFKLNRQNRVVAILGESGMGKTTIFKSIFANYLKIWKMENRLELICEHEINGSRFTYKELLEGSIPNRIGFATQVPYFFLNQSVKNNLLGPLKWKNIRLEKAKKDNFVSTFKLDGLLGEKVSHLSGGQLQLLNIARCLILEPEIAILDECFSSMDESMAKEYINIIKNNFTKSLFIITSHRISDIKNFGCKIIKLNKKYYESGFEFVTQE